MTRVWSKIEWGDLFNHDEDWLKKLDVGLTAVHAAISKRPAGDVYQISIQVLMSNPTQLGVIRVMAD